MKVCKQAFRILALLERSVFGFGQVCLAPPFSGGTLSVVGVLHVTIMSIRAGYADGDRDSRER